MRTVGTLASRQTSSAEPARRQARRWALQALPLALVVLLSVDGVAAQDQEAAYEIVGLGIPQPLTGAPGDPTRGEQVLRDAANATCLICHTMPIPDEPDPGNLAPDLAGVGNRYTAAELRLRLVDPKEINPDTIMPSYYLATGFTRVQEKYAGKSIYSAQDIEDVISYLMTLTADRTLDESVLMLPAVAEGSAASLLQVENRVSGYLFLGVATRALQDDDFLNPGMFAVDKGAEIWRRAEGTAGLSCFSCHGDAAESMRGVAARLPRFDAERAGVINLEILINREREWHLGAAPLPYESEELLALTAYIAFQSRGIPRDVDVSGPAQPFFEAGRDFYLARRGQLDLACVHCHDQRAGQMLRGDRISQGQTTGFPFFRLMWNVVASTQRMFVWCNESLRARAYPLGSDEYLNLELYTAWRGRGLPMEAPAVRR
jgi:sulfur-oxidizing protein SoxA